MADVQVTTRICARRSSDVHRQVLDRHMNVTRAPVMAAASWRGDVGIQEAKSTAETFERLRRLVFLLPGV